MDRNKRLVKTTFIYFIGTFGSKLLIFFLLPLYSHHLSTEQFGNINLVTNIVPLIGPIFTLQITETIFRFLCTAKDDEREKYISNAIFLFLIGILSFIIIYIPVATIIKFEYKWLFIIYFILNYVATFMQQILRGFGKNTDYTITGVISTVIQLIINILFIQKLLEKTILVSSTAAYSIIFIYTLFRIKIYKYINIKLISKKVIKEMLKYSLPLIPNQVSWWFNDAVGIYILSFFAGASVTGITSLANKFPAILATVNIIFLMAWTENSILEYKSEDKSEYYSKGLEIFTIVIILLCAMLLPAVSVYFDAFIEQQYAEAKIIVPIMFLATIFNSLATFVGTVYTASMKTKGAFYTTMIAAVVNVLLDFLLIPKFGFYGYAFANTISYIIFYIVRKISVQKIVVIKDNYKKYCTPLVLYVLSSVVYIKGGIVFNIGYEVVLLVAIFFMYRQEIKTIAYKILNKGKN